MTQYALNDRGTVEIITDDFYDAEILDVFEGRRLDLEQILDLSAELVPEPGNPVNPETVAVWVKGRKVGRMTAEDSARYWNALSRVVASGYTPVAPLRLWAESRRMHGVTFLTSRGVLSLAKPDYLFPINVTPTHAALLPQGPSVKVLGEQDHAEYLHAVLPESGDGRVILTLEADTAKGPDGQPVDVVDVLHDRKVVGRLSTWMAAQLAPVVRYAFENNKLTAAWGTIRGNAFELSLTVQAVRAADIPRQWYLDLPNDLPVLKEPRSEYVLESSYALSSAETDPTLVRRSPAPRSAPADQEVPVPRAQAGSRRAPRQQAARDPRGIFLMVLGVLLALGGLALFMAQPGVATVGIVVGLVLVLVGLSLDHQNRRRSGTGHLTGAKRREDAADQEDSAATPVAQDEPLGAEAAGRTRNDELESEDEGPAHQGGQEQPTDSPSRHDEGDARPQAAAVPEDDEEAEEEDPQQSGREPELPAPSVEFSDHRDAQEGHAEAEPEAEAEEDWADTEYVDPTFDDYENGSAYEEYSEASESHTPPASSGSATTTQAPRRRFPRWLSRR